MENKNKGKKGKQKPDTKKRVEDDLIQPTITLSEYKIIINQLNQLTEEIKEIRNVKKELAEFIFQFLTLFFGIVGIIVAIIATNTTYLEYISNQLSIIYWLTFFMLMIWFLIWSIPKINEYRKREKADIIRKIISESQRDNLKELVEQIIEKHIKNSKEK